MSSSMAGPQEESQAPSAELQASPKASSQLCSNTIALGLGLAFAIAVGAALAVQALRSPALSRSLWRGLGLGPGDVWPLPGTALSRTPSAVPGLHFPGWSSTTIHQGIASTVAALQMELGFVQAELGSPTTLPILTLDGLDQYLSLAPTVSLQAQGFVKGMVLLPGGGIAAGTGARTVDLWPTISSVQQGGPPAKSLQTSGIVRSLISLPEGGIAAGTDANTVDLWPNSSSVLQGGSPIRRLQASGKVYSLLSLPGGGIAAGTFSSRTVDVWPNASSVEQGCPPIILRASGSVMALLLLKPGGGIAAGTSGAGRVDVWPNASSVLEGGPPTMSLRPSVLGAVGALLALPDGGVAAGTQVGLTLTNTVDLWPNASSILEAGPPPISLQASSLVCALLLLPGGGIAAGTYAGTLDLWPTSSSLQQSGPPVKQLDAPGEFLSLLLLPGGGIAAGTDSGKVYLWPHALWPRQSSPPVIHLQSRGSVLALLSLPRDGIAAAGAGIVYLWPNASSVQQGGPAATSLQPNAAGRVINALSSYQGSDYNGVGIAAGGFGWGVDVWPDARSVQQGGSPLISLRASGPVFGLVSLRGGGIAAGTSISTVDVWPDQGSVQQGGPPVILQATGSVFALVVLPGGGIAAGTGSSTVDLWQNASWAQEGGSPTKSLQASGAVYALLSLPDGGIAAGTGSGTVDVWPGTSSIRQGDPPLLRLQASGAVYALLRLPGGGIAAGTGSDSSTGANGIDLWPCLASIPERGLPVRSLQTSDTVRSLLSLSDGGIAAGTDASTVDLWPGAASVQEAERRLQGSGVVSQMLSHLGEDTNPGTSNKPKPWGGEVAPAGFVFSAFHLGELVALGILNATGTAVLEIWTTSGALQGSLLTGGVASATALLQSGHLVVATGNQTISIWAPRGSSGWDLVPLRLLTAKGLVKSLAPLPDGGFAVLSSVGQRSLLEIWTSSGLAPDRSLDLDPLAAPTALLWWKKGLAVGSVQGLEYRPFTNLSSPFPLNVSGEVTALKALPSGGLVVALGKQVSVWRTSATALQGAAPDITLTTPGTVASMAILSDGALVAGGAAFYARACSTGTFSIDGLTCTLCPKGWLSQKGASSCHFPDIPRVLESSGVFIGLLFSSLVLSYLLMYLPWCSAKRLSWSKQLFAAAGSGCIVAGGLALATTSWSLGTVVLLILAALGSLLLVSEAIAQTHAQFLALALLLLAGSQALLLLLTPEGQTVFTVAGDMESQKSFWGFIVLVVGLCLATVAYAIPRVKSFTDGRALPAPEEHLSSVFSPGHQAFEIETESPQHQGLASRSKQAVLRIAKSFSASHFVSLAISVYTAVQMRSQLRFRQSGDVGATLIVVSILLATMQGLVSCTAILVTSGILPRFVGTAAVVIVDRHFRIALALKKLALAMKLLVLTLPFPVVIPQPYLWQVCQIPTLCPRTCTGQRGGTCGTSVSTDDGTVNGACTCSALEGKFEMVMLNAGVSVGISLCFTLVGVVKYWRHERYLRSISHPRMKLVAQTFLALVPATAQMLFLYMISEAQQCIALADVAIIIYPSMMLELMASEVKRALQGWSEAEGQRRYSTVYSDHLLLTLRPFGAVLSSMAAALCMARASGVSSTWPSSTVDCSGSSFWASISVSFFIGAVAATLMGPVSAPEVAQGNHESLTE